MNGVTSQSGRDLHRPVLVTEASLSCCPGDAASRKESILRFHHLSYEVKLWRMLQKFIGCLFGTDLRILAFTARRR
jgi:hypothetical protein